MSFTKNASDMSQYLVVKDFLNHKEIMVVQGMTYMTETHHVLITCEDSYPIRYFNPNGTTVGCEWYPYTPEGVDAAMDDIRQLAANKFETFYEKFYQDASEAMEKLSGLFDPSGTELLPQQSTSPSFWQHLSFS